MFISLFHFMINFPTLVLFIPTNIKDMKDAKRNGRITVLSSSTTSNPWASNTLGQFGYF